VFSPHLWPSPPQGLTQQGSFLDGLCFLRLASHWGLVHKASSLKVWLPPGSAITVGLAFHHLRLHHFWNTGTGPRGLGHPGGQTPETCVSCGQLMNIPTNLAPNWDFHHRRFTVQSYHACYLETNCLIQGLLSPISSPVPCTPWHSKFVICPCWGNRHPRASTITD
jgi:hypothetical protein